MDGSGGARKLALSSAPSVAAPAEKGPIHQDHPSISFTYGYAPEIVCLY